MALTRAQLLAGNQSQGNVLSGQVQGVTAGPGVVISTNGVLSLNGSDPTFNGFIKTNNNLAYNAYVWPGVDGAASTFLQTDGNGNLSWASAPGFPVVTVSGTAPTPSDVGELWYDTVNTVLKVYQTSVTPAGWTITSQPSGLGLVVSGSSLKTSVPIQFGPPATGTLSSEAVDGSTYWDDNLGAMFIRYNDGTSTQWVQVIPS